MKICALISLLLCNCSAFATDPGSKSPPDQSTIDVEKFMAGSDLFEKMDTIRPRTDDDPKGHSDVNKIVDFMQVHSDDMFAGIEYYRKFHNLRAFYSIIRHHPDNQEMVPHLFRKFEELEVLESDISLYAGSWGEIEIAMYGGPLGQTIETLAIIGGREAIGRMLDHSIETEDLPRLEEILRRLRNPEIEHESTDLLEQRIGAETLEAVNELLRKELALREEIAR